MAQHQKHFKTPTSWADRAEFLAQARLLQTYLPEEECLPQFQPSLAALLLFGKIAAIERNVPFSKQWSLQRKKVFQSGKT